ncbi:Retrotransposon gag protein [Abeliophyllum distichum]|uniref:Retrotransposon gag protein n=1 Tax=Abeliophyllum distichum TaxID=126358 RepID=A0ABD1RSQ2_9LAMI
MEKYDGSSDPVDHLKAFIDLMRLQATPDAIISKRTKKIAISLMQLTQDKDERLKDFIVRFNRTTLGIKDLQISTVVTSMMSETRSRPFKMSLSKNSSDTMHELLSRGDKYVDAEEAYIITKNMRDRKETESNKRKTWDELEPRDDKGKQKINYQQWTND